jgi:uncharacterized protein with von Willebrand factor type A (vWA) domain
VNDPALLELFTCLRKAGLPLGVAEYHLLLRAINRGFGTRDRDALSQLCRALWVKSQREEQIFQDYFDQIIPQRPEPILLPIKPEKSKSIDKPVISRGDKAFQIIKFLLLGGTICVVGIGCIFLLNYFIKLINKPPNQPELQFSSASFTADTSEKVALVKIIHTGSSDELVSAKLNIGKKCLQNIYRDTSKTSDNSIVNDSSQYVQIDGKTGEKIIKISLSKPSKPDVFINSVTLCLTDSQDKIISGEQKIAILVIQNKDYWFQNFPYLNYFKPLLITSCCITILLVTWKMWNIQQLQTTGDESLIPDAETNLFTNVLSPEVIQTIANEIQTTQSSRQDNPLSELFPLIVNDLPVTLRQMKQGWRYLRQFSREGAPTELDLEATIQQVSQQGILLSPVLVPRRTNRIELLLLIDRDGSMVPFHHFAQELADTAFRGGRFSRVRVRYFHNCPDESLYRDPYHLEAEPIDDCLLNLPKARTVCLIFSDAGAARGGLNSRRRRLTKFFLKELGQHVRYIAWLNPVPRQRWETTTAEDIATLVPMFEVNRQEFYRAIDVLRGRYQPLGKVFR